MYESNSSQHVDRVPELHYFSTEPKPVNYTVTKEGYRVKGTKDITGNKIPGYSVIIRQVDYGGRSIFVRWKVHRGTEIHLHPDFKGFRDVTGFNPVKPRRLLNKEHIRGDGAVLFNEPRPEKGVSSEYMVQSKKDEDGNVLWKTARDLRREDVDYEEDYGIDEDGIRYQTTDMYSSTYRDYMPSPNPWIS